MSTVFQLCRGRFNYIAGVSIVSSVPTPPSLAGVDAAVALTPRASSSSWQASTVRGDPSAEELDLEIEGDPWRALSLGAAMRERLPAVVVTG
jgi:hypothetical protein